MSSINTELPCERSLLEKRIGYRFKRDELLVEALTHSSYSNEHGGSKQSPCNERLEFLGDSVLSVITSEYIYEKFSSSPEGDLTRMRSELVCEKALADFADEIGRYNFPADIDVANYTSAVKNAYKFLGCTLGMWVIYEVDTRFIRFDTKTAKWWAQIIKLAVGFGLLLVVMEGSKPLFNLIFKGNYIAYAIRYFLTVLFAGAVWPLTFKFWGKCGK